MKPAHSSLEFLRRVSRRRRSAEQGVESISEYVEQRAALLTPEDLADLRTELPLLTLGLTKLQCRNFRTCHPN
jgi:hypothetical protein